MQYLLSIFSVFIYSFSFSQVNSIEYLANNRTDLLTETKIEIGQAKIIGFGALHGSSRTETTENIILTSLVDEHNLKYYFPETDYSTAFYFQKYIESGDEDLLEELVFEYGAMVPQEKSIEVFKKWKNIRPVFLKNDIRIVGIDKISSYKFTVKDLVSLIKENSNWKFRDSLKMLDLDTNTNWTAFYKTETRVILEHFVEDFTKNRAIYHTYIKDTVRFNHILKNLKHTFNRSYRETIIYKNYLVMKKKFSLENSVHFCRFGIFHIMKSKLNNGTPFFARLIEDSIYNSSEVLTIQGFLTKSSVLWESVYDKNGIYQKGITKKGFGISDYWLEYFYDVKQLKKSKLSDITMFYLNSENNPYSIKDEFKLITVKRLFGRSPWIPEAGKSTLDYIDYAILISNSDANQPIEELK